MLGAFKVEMSMIPQESMEKVEASAAQLIYLMGGTSRIDGKLPLFDENGEQFHQPTIDAVVKKGWAEPVYTKTFLKDMEIYRITELGRKIMREVTG